MEKDKRAREGENEGRGGVSAVLRGEFLRGLIFVAARAWDDSPETGEASLRQTRDRTNNERNVENKWGRGEDPTWITRHCRENLHRLLTEKCVRERDRERRKVKEKEGGRYFTKVSHFFVLRFDQ